MLDNANTAAKPEGESANSHRKACLAWIEELFKKAFCHPIPYLESGIQIERKRSCDFLILLFVNSAWWAVQRGFSSFALEKASFWGGFCGSIKPKTTKNCTNPDDPLVDKRLRVRPSSKLSTLHVSTPSLGLRPRSHTLNWANSPASVSDQYLSTSSESPVSGWPHLGLRPHSPALFMTNVYVRFSNRLITSGCYWNHNHKWYS